MRGRLIFSGTMEEIRRRAGVHGTVRVRVTGDVNKAVELLSAMPQVQGVQIVADRIAVTLGDDQADSGLIARTLVQAGIDVCELVPERLQLDDAYLRLTRGIVH